MKTPAQTPETRHMLKTEKENLGVMRYWC